MCVCVSVRQKNEELIEKGVDKMKKLKELLHGRLFDMKANDKQFVRFGVHFLIFRIRCCTPASST